MYPNNVHSQTNGEQKITGATLLQFFLAMFVILWIATPAIQNISFIRSYMILGFYFMWLSMVLLNRKNFLIELISGSVWLLVWLVVLVVWHRSLDNIFMSFLFMFMMYSIYLYYTLQNNIYLNKICGWVILLSFILTAIITIREISINPLFSKIISTGEYTDNKGAGAFGFIYALVGVIPSLFINLKSARIFKKIILLAAIGLFIYTVIISTFTTAFIFMVSTVLLVFIPINKITIIITVVLLISFFSFRTDIALWLNYYSVYITNPQINEKVIDIALKLNGDDLGVNSSLGARMGFYYDSLTTFVKNPFIGVGGYYGDDSDLKGIGGHSEWLDNLARFGIIGAAPLFLFLFSYYRRLKKTYENTSYKKAIFIFFFYIVLLGFVNPVLKTHINIDMFIFLPFIMYLGLNDNVRSPKTQADVRSLNFALQQKTTNEASL